MEGLCVNCHKTGTVKLMLSNIPFFREVIISSFDCSYCGYKNSEMTNAGKLGDKGIKLTLKIMKPEDLKRMVVAGIKSLIYIPEIDFEVPSLKKGSVSTVEGMINSFGEDLRLDQEKRKELQPEIYQKIEEFLALLKKYETGDPSVLPFHFIIDDASGHSHISNPHAPLKDNFLKIEKYEQTKEQLYRLGYISETDMEKDKDLKKKYNEMKNDYKNFKKLKKTEQSYSDKDVSDMMKKMQGQNKKKDAHKLDHSKPLKDQDFDYGTSTMIIPCIVCNKDSEMKTCKCEIPFFKEIVIMCMFCEHCHYKTVDVKTSGDVSEKAKKIVLKIEKKPDLNRDIFKSDTAVLKIPEIGLELTPGTLGSFYTTVEGLVLKIKESLTTNNPFIGDSSNKDQTNKFKEFMDKLDELGKGELLPFTLIIDDPMDNCFILNPHYPNEDPQIEITEYERTAQQNDELGITFLLEEERKRKELEAKQNK